MTELRRRMIEDLQLAGLSQSTQEAYVRSVRQLAEHFRLPPDRITERQLRDYLIHLLDVRRFAKGTVPPFLRRTHPRDVSRLKSAIVHCTLSSRPPRFERVAGSS